MSVINNNLLLTAAAAGGYQVSRSLRFNGSVDSTYLERTPASAGNRKTWTWSAWVKRSSGDQFNYLFDAVTTDPSTGENRISFEDNKIKWYSNSTTDTVETVAVFRDFSAWYHIVFAYNSTEATSSNRIKIYVNGVQQTLTGTYPALNAEPHINNTRVHNIGRSAAYGRYFNGYLADIWFLDGIAATPSDFAETDATTGQWIPKAYTGSKGTNGFHLEFADNSAATASTLGKDTSGNGNNWTPNNFVAQANGGTVWSSYVAGTPYSALYPARYAFDGNTNNYALAAIGTSFTFTPPSAIPISSSLRIWGNRVTSTGSSSTLIINGSNVTSQLTSNSYQWNTITGFSSITSISWSTTNANDCILIAAIEVDGAILIDGVPGKELDSLVDTPTSYGTGNSGGDVRGNFATFNPLDKGPDVVLSNGNLDFTTGAGTGICRSTIGMSSGKWYAEWTFTNGTSSNVGLATSKANLSSYLGSDAFGWNYWNYTGEKGNNATNSAYGATYAINDVIGVAFDADNGTLTYYKNGVSQGVAFSGLTSGPYYFAAGTGGVTGYFNFGQRAFAYTPPANHKALCDTNLTAPVVAKPGGSFQTVLYTGNNSNNHAITGFGFSPSLLWVKARSAAYDHMISDVVRGKNFNLRSNLTSAEATDTSNIASFDSDGFTTSQDSGYMNGNGVTFVAWAWNAGSSTVTNTQGSISSQVRANASAGFSIVTFTGSSGSQTIGHGLGVAPQLVILKYRNGASGWYTYHGAIAAGNNKLLKLNSSDAVDSSANYWNSTAPTSTVFTLGSDLNTTNTWVAYCFAPVTNYSAFGTYQGNLSTNGPFVYTGFRPAVVLIKSSSNAENWIILDNKRLGYNVDNQLLYPNLSNSESGADALDLLSNGFKIRLDDNVCNGSGYTYVWAAWAENPFAYARAR